MAYVKLLLHGDGDDGSQTIIDTSAVVGKTVTAVGNAQIDTAQKEFGTGSILFDGTGDSLSIVGGADFDFTGDLTVDFWCRFNSIKSQTFFNIVHEHLGYYTFVLFTPDLNTIILYTRDGNSSWTLGSSLVVNTWYHIAIVRSGSTITGYLNGTSIGTRTDGNELNVDQDALYIGNNSGGSSSFDGWIDEFRISKGVARWTSNFTPPTSAYPDYGVEAYTQNFLDAIATSDTKATTRGVVLNLLDSMSSSDSKTQRLAYGQTYLDSVSLTDLISMAKEYGLDLIDGMSLSDFIERVARLSQAFPDAITLQDIFNRVLVGTRNFLDTSVMSDDVYKDLTKAYKDEVILRDAISLLKKLNKLFEDSVTLTDRENKAMGKPFQDMITLTDILSRVATLSVSPKDIITLNEKDFSIIYTDRDIIEISADPQIQAGNHGQFLSLQYVTDYPKLRWVDGRGLKLFKGKQFTMNSGSMINFIYDSANNVWQETSRMQDIGVLQGEG